MLIWPHKHKSNQGHITNIKRHHLALDLPAIQVMSFNLQVDIYRLYILSPHLWKYYDKGTKQNINFWRDMPIENGILFETREKRTMISLI
jgi:hypothetical protein